MKTLSMFLLLLLVGTSPEEKSQPNIRQIEPEVGDISGYYVCKGTDTEKPYSGICVITRKGDVHIVQWVVAGGPNFNGIAVRQGNTLAVSWTMGAEKGLVRGVNLYQIKAGPRLAGRWASVPGNGIQHTETLTFLRPLDREE